MKKIILVFLFILFSLSRVLSQVNYNLDSTDFKALKACEGVINLFKQNPDKIWKGFDLSKMPFLFYIPDKWVLVFNYEKKIDEFEKYPDNWPDLGTKVQIHFGKYKDLGGQLGFDYKLDTIKIVAIPFLFENSTLLDLFAFIVHESFHQYQHYSFGEIGWQKEEMYPIQDSINTTLASIEMKLLMDAYEASYKNKLDECKELMKMFVAVRDYRWKQNKPYIFIYEQGIEINEGTAKYAEVKSLLFLNKLKYKSSFSKFTKLFNEGFEESKNPDIILNDFKLRMKNNSISPGNMSRNRVYPVGSTQGLVLDYFGIDWKDLAQKAGLEFTFAKLVADYLKIDTNDFNVLLEKAKEKYDYDSILQSSANLINRYLLPYQEAMEKFNLQEGYKFEINFNVERYSRSTSSSERKWMINSGLIEFCKDYKLFSLKGDNYLLQLKDVGVVEENNREKKTKNIAFYFNNLTGIKIDGIPVEIDNIVSVDFNNIEIDTGNLLFNASVPGSITKSNNNIKINIAK
jgi:hypothetical protein